MTATAQPTTSTLESFNGTYTFENTATGKHRTLRIKTQRPDANFAPGARILSLMSGTDNETHYTNFAFVQSNNKVNVWKSKRGNGKKSAFEFYAALIAKAAQALNAGTDQEEIAGEFSFCDRTYKVTLAKRCLACNRKLTNPESLSRGFGPECAARLGLV